MEKDIKIKKENLKREAELISAANRATLSYFWDFCKTVIPQNRLQEAYTEFRGFVKECGRGVWEKALEQPAREKHQKHCRSQISYVCSCTGKKPNDVCPFCLKLKIFCTGEFAGCHEEKPDHEETMDEIENFMGIPVIEDNSLKGNEWYLENGEKPYRENCEVCNFNLMTTDRNMTQCECGKYKW